MGHCMDVGNKPGTGSTPSTAQGDAALAWTSPHRDCRAACTSRRCFASARIGRSMKASLGGPGLSGIANRQLRLIQRGVMTVGAAASLQLGGDEAGQGEQGQCEGAGSGDGLNIPV